MVNLILVEGKSGSGKTTVAKYVESNFGFSRVSIDDCIDRLALPRGIGFGGFVYQIYVADSGFWSQFHAERGKLPYDYASATCVLQGYTEGIRNKIYAPEEDMFHVKYAIWDGILSERESSMASGNDVVVEAFVSRPSKEAVLETTQSDMQKYLIRLNVSDETAIRRTVDRGWPLEKAIQRNQRQFDWSLPDMEFAFIEYTNETPADLDEIKEDLKRRFKK